MTDRATERVLCTSLNAETGPHFEVLTAAGFEVEVVDRGLNLFDDHCLQEVLGGYCGVIAGSEPYSARMLAHLPALRTIARTGVGYDAIDLAACDRHEIVVSITPGVNHESVAEHTLALLLAVARGFPEQDRRVRECRWETVPTSRIAGRVLGLIGVGRIGRAVANRATAFGLRVIAHDPFADADDLTELNVEAVSLDDLLARSDFVSLHCPATEETRELIDGDAIDRMKPGSVLINTARGSLVDEFAVADAIGRGHLAGAGLDVFELEPLPKESPLLSCPQVLLSGHIAGLDHESHADSFRMAAESIVTLSRGGWPAVGVVNGLTPDRFTWSR